MGHPQPNHALEPTPNSLRSCVAPAIARGSRPAVGGAATLRRDTMDSGRFVVVTWNGGGNAASTYPLVRGLVPRGHKVTILGQPAQAEAARERGATFAPLGLPDWPPGKSIEE